MISLFLKSVFQFLVIVALCGPWIYTLWMKIPADYDESDLDYKNYTLIDIQEERRHRAVNLVKLKLVNSDGNTVYRTEYDHWLPHNTIWRLKYRHLGEEIRVGINYRDQICKIETLTDGSYIEILKPSELMLNYREGINYDYFLLTLFLLMFFVGVYHVYIDFKNKIFISGYLDDINGDVFLVKASRIDFLYLMAMVFLVCGLGYIFLFNKFGLILAVTFSPLIFLGLLKTYKYAYKLKSIFNDIAKVSKDGIIVYKYSNEPIRWSEIEQIYFSLNGRFSSAKEPIVLIISGRDNCEIASGSTQIKTLDLYNVLKAMKEKYS
ncbi:hypothetical protein SAMN03080615_03035 [Amphritea atlantica]|uniref:Uncharacterized protein n=1 Tax=Amphritea atlantica TaxID=355243 RepID=A0A1H9JI85_9GAMM|nr:hypothetical protein [Amphritea atlantica]SEQ86530.1 hypothetical protein SAMN03080615_03035 [Amphritea atlantica]